MDPNAALTRIRELVTVIEDEEGDVGPYVTAELAELISGLDSALTRGMFLPEPWALGRKA